MVSVAASVTSQTPLAELIVKASQRRNSIANYVGELLPHEVFAYLLHEDGWLVDVRTVPEWQFVGQADLSGCRGKLAAISWKAYPEMAENPNFLAQFVQMGIAKDTPVFFMCRGGGRSASAAQAMTAAGYSYCFNVATGFEGEADASGHRGRMNGWQGAGLPWKH